jgi:hypothetical protein
MAGSSPTLAGIPRAVGAWDVNAFLFHNGYYNSILPS